MTKEQEWRRANAVARAYAKHPVAIAIVGSAWRSCTHYAESRLGISQSTFSRYLSGKLDTPPEVADWVFKDFALDDRVWKRPPRRFPSAA